MALRRMVNPPRRGLRREKSDVITLADRARDAGQWELAAGLYRKALDRYPRNAGVWVQYGHALKESGELRDPDKLAQAELAYRTALSLDPGVADTHLQVGHVLKLQGKTSEAEAAYLRAFALDPSMPYPQEELTGLGWSEVNLAELRGMLQWEIKKKTFDGSSSSGRSPLTEGDSSADIAVSLIPPAAEGCVSDDPQTLKLYIDKPEIADGSAERTIRSDLLIEGWALARSGVASIDVAVDGHYLTSAHYGMPRSDVAEAHPGWANSERAGFMLSIPGRLLPSGRRAVRVTLRDNSGNTREVAFWIDVAENSGEDGLRRKISQAEIDLQGRLLSSLDWHPNFCLLMSVGYGQDEIARAQTTLVSLREQAYADWHVFITLGDHGGKPDALSNTLVDTLHSFLQDGSNSLESWRDSVLDDFDDVSDRVEILERREEQSLAALIGRFGDPLLFGVLAAGDELSRDALLEFAVISGMHRDADFLYSDELRISPVSKALEPFLKPQWSPDLLLSTNYIGRLWCAKAELVERTGATLADVFQLGEYDLVLRATEAATAIRHIPELLCRRCDERLDSEAMEWHALERTMARRGIPGDLRRGCVTGVYRLQRPLTKRGLVSVVMPTGGRVELLSKAVAGVLDQTGYDRIELILVYNTSTRPEAFPYFETLSGDPRVRVIDSKGPFNFSRVCNLGAASARGEFLLFLNDDIEVIEPGWLDALLEHAQRPEVGVVGPMLLWPDRTVQSAGVFLTNDVGIERHAFRNIAEGDPGYFGLALTQRNVVAINGACFLTRRVVFEKLGGLNEAHRVVNNETDYCLKAWREGLLLVFTPYAKLIHHERATRQNIEAEEYDAADFEAQWGALFADGDPYHHRHLSKERDCFAPEPERLRVIRPGHPLVKREAIRRILLVKLDHIGDCITAFPAIRRLKQAFPHASLRVLAGHWSKPIWSLADMVDEVIEFDFFHARSDQLLREVTETELQSLRERLLPYRFDLAVDLRRHTETRRVLQYTGARFLAGYDVRGNFPWLDIAPEWGEDAARKRKRGHAADELVNLADAICAACEPARSIMARPSDGVLPVSESLKRWLFTRRVVCVHPAAGGTLKQWPPEHFAKLIDMLVERDRVNVVLIGGLDDKSITSRVLRSVRNRSAVVDLIGEPVNKFAQLHNLLLHCALFVGNDSGPKHLAAGLGVPTVGIHSGQIDAREWGPAGPYAIALQREMECSPCYLTNPADCHRRAACLTGLMPGEVYTACKKLLAIGPVCPSHGTDGPSEPYGAAIKAGPSSIADANPLTGTNPYGENPDYMSPRAGENCSEYVDAQWYLKSNPDVASSGMDPLKHFIKYGRNEGRKPNAGPGAWVAVTDADIRCLKEPSFQNEMALFVTHSPHGHLKPHVYHYLDSLRRHGIAVVLIVAADAPFVAADSKLMAATDGIYVRHNQGYDFAAWAHILRLRPEFFAATMLYLINDSLFGPTNDELFGQVLERLRSTPAGLVGLTENYADGWHIQSYFLALRPPVLSSAVFQRFIRDIVSYSHKVDVINEYEVKLASTLTAAGFECEAIFRANDITNDMTTHHWQHLFQSGFPFVKMGVLRGTVEGVDTSDWREVLVESGFGVSLAEKTLAEERGVAA